MKTSKVIRKVVFGGLILLAAGCIERRVYVPVYQPTGVISAPPPVVTEANPQPAVPGNVVVTEPPPAPQVEVIPSPPGPAYVWVPGFWSWQGRWVWVNGYYVLRPRPHAVWVGGRWARHPHGYVWERGHWR